MTTSIPVIAFFNNKGGVGKTTLVYHLAWMCAQLGMTVLAADLDPQANLTDVCLTDDVQDALGNLDEPATIYAAVSPLILGTGDVRQDVVLQQLNDTDGTGGLYLLPGDLALSRFEQQLSDEWAGARNGEVRALRVTSAIWRVLQHAARRISAQIILVDMGPNLGAINRTILISSDHIVIPMTPDRYALQGLKNLGDTLVDWRQSWDDAKRRKKPEVDFDLPVGIMQPLGYIVIQHSERQRRGDGKTYPVGAYRKWIDRIPADYAHHVLVDQESDGARHQIGLIKHYQSLMAMSQESRKPIFHLRPADGAIGGHVNRVREAEANFRDVAISILDKIGMPLPLE